MAKRSASAAALAVPAPAAAQQGKGTASNLASRAIDLGKQQPDVIEWDSGNGVSTFQQGTLPPEPTGGEGDQVAAGDAAADGGEKPPEQKTETEEVQADGGEGSGTVSPIVTAPAAKPKGAAARSAAMQALDAERSRVTLEQQARANAERATAAEAEIARVKAMPLKERLKWIGANKEELSEAVLVDSDDVADLPDKPTAQPDPEKEELRKRVKTLEDRDAAREGTAAQQAISAGHQVVADALKDVTTVPMVKSVRDVVIDGTYVHSGIDLTLKTAHQAWLQAGKAGHPRDYIAGASEVVESYLREKRPDIAELVDARGATPAPAGGQPTTPARNGGPTSIGKRTAPRPDAQPKELPMDRHQRDQQIKREMGWG